MIKRLLYHPLTAIIITIMVGLFVMSLRQTQQKNQRADDVIKQWQDKIARQELELKQLEGESNQQKLDFQQEKMLRDELLLQKEGEIVLQLPSDASHAASDQEVIELNSTTPWQEWQKLLF